MVNRFESICCYCHETVPANGGHLWKAGRAWRVSHLECGRTGRSEVVVTRFNSGATVTQNRRGRCEDAPCCGCCT